jgi:hypothetical protein
VARLYFDGYRNVVVETAQTPRKKNARIEPSMKRNWLTESAGFYYVSYRVDNAKGARK